MNMGCVAGGGGGGGGKGGILFSRGGKGVVWGCVEVVVRVIVYHLNKQMAI